MLLTEAPAAWQFCFPTLHAQSGGKHEATPTGFVLRFHIAKQFICNSYEFISQKNRIILDLSDFPEVILNN